MSINPDMLSVRLIAMCCNEYDKIIFDIPSLDILHVYADRKNDKNDTCTFFQHTTISMHVSYVQIICVKLAVGWPYLLCKSHSHMHEPRLIRMEYFKAVRFFVIAGLCNFRMKGNVTQYSVDYQINTNRLKNMAAFKFNKTILILHVNDKVVLDLISWVDLPLIHV